MKWILILFLFSTFGCATPPRHLSKQNAGTVGDSAREEIVPLMGAFQVHRILFQNGLRLLIIEDHSSPTFAYQTWYQVGSRNEIIGKTGLAHLFEHLMFKETKNLKDGEFDRLLEGAGVEGENAFTSRDYTAYIQELPSSQLELIVKAEAERMTNVIVNDKSFKTEREVVQNERRFRNENSPDGLMDQELFELGFKKHPYHWPIIGYQKDLDSMTAQDASDFYHTYYSPNHATVIIVGDVKVDQAKSLVEKYYGPLAPHQAPDRMIPQEQPQKASLMKTLKLNIQVEKLLLGYKIPEFVNEDLPALDVLQSILTGGKNNRLQEALVETGIASSVGSDDFEDKDPSLFVIMANLQKNRKASEAEPIILKELKNLSTKRVSQSELERAKNKLQFSFYQGLESNYDKAYFLGHYEVLAGDFTAGLEHEKKIRKVTPEDVLRVTKKYFRPENRSAIIGVRK